jgi:hypothetical protein
MIDIGVGEAQSAGAGDDQNGHGVDERVRHPRLGPDRRPDNRGATAARDDSRHEVAETTSASFWIGARLRCACATMVTIRARSVSAPTRSAPNQRTRSVHRRAGDLVSDAFLDRDRLAADHRFVNGAVPSRTTSIDRHFLPGLTRSRSPTCT